MPNNRLIVIGGTLVFAVVLALVVGNALASQQALAVAMGVAVGVLVGVPAGWAVARFFPQQAQAPPPRVALPEELNALMLTDEEADYLFALLEEGASGGGATRRRSSSSGGSSSRPPSRTQTDREFTAVGGAALPEEEAPVEADEDEV